ncbi:MAG: hypothetical protein OXB84_06555, partial [Halobacteriovoraceae bacterium]|nr:hypothetical protein [Halobacteriovoraceae bacterium]
AVGHKTSCAIMGDDSLKCWGSNSHGQLGQNDTVNRGDVTGSMTALAKINLGTGRTARFVGVSTNGNHVCAILDDDSLKCWGANDYGQLGIGGTDHQGDDSGEMAALSSIDLGGQTVKSVSAGGRHTCAILDDDSVKCWGRNNYGQLGRNAALPGGNITDNIGSASVGEIASISPIDLGTGRTARSITAGSDFTCVVLDNGNAKCWGFNGSGNLGLEDTDHRGDDAGEMATLSSVDFAANIKNIFAGNQHVCVVLNDDGVKCWGNNLYGQLGLDSMDAQGDDPNEMTNLPFVDLGIGRTVLNLATGGNHTCAVLDDNTLKCWGRNHVGQLGLGDDLNRGDEPNEMMGLPLVGIF